MECSWDASINDYDYEGPEFFKDKMVVARKQHKCSECCQAIEPGVKYEHVYGIWDGDTHTYKTCPDCLSLRQQFFLHGYYYEQLWDDFKDAFGYIDSEIPESCISKLTPGARARVCAMIEKWWNNGE